MTSLFDQSETSFDRVDQAEQSAAFAGYLTHVAASLAGLKRGLHDLLEVRPGDSVLDVGCGTGTDVLTLADRVGPAGRVVGVDNSQLLIGEAKGRAKGRGLPVAFEVSDAHELPFPDATFDATRCERVMMHVADPARALGELIRVTRPGGRVLVADPDHGMWALDARDIQLTRSLLGWWFDFIANPWIARQMRALFSATGLHDVRTRVLPITIFDLDEADAITGITRAATVAAEQGIISPAQQQDFDRELRAHQADGQFFMCGAVIATVGRRLGAA
jgi:ubiquinone/menaquinone biosynthesis C-methylase UbiE